MRNAWNHHLAKPLVFNINLHSTLEKTWENNSLIESYLNGNKQLQTTDHKRSLILDQLIKNVHTFSKANKKTLSRDGFWNGLCISLLCVFVLHIHPPKHQRHAKTLLWKPRSPFVSTVLDQNPRLERPRLEHSACLTAPVAFSGESDVVLVFTSESEVFFICFLGWVAGGVRI